MSRLYFQLILHKFMVTFPGKNCSVFEPAVFQPDNYFIQSKPNPLQSTIFGVLCEKLLNKRQS